MARRGSKKTLTLPGDPNDAQGLRAWSEAYLEAIRVKGLSANTERIRFLSLSVFLGWCQERDLTDPRQITRPILQRYQRWLFHYRRKNGKPLSFSTQMTRITSVRMLFKWLTRENVLLSNPASELEVPQVKRHAPKQILTIDEMEEVLAQPDVSDPLGLRDRAILETFYSTAIRRQELLDLSLYDLDFSRGTVYVKSGKGNKDRTVPIGERAMAWCAKYLREARPQLVSGKDEGWFFLNRFGQSLLSSRVSVMVRNCIRGAKVGKEGSCHLLRHTAATLMMEGGADLRSIQVILGHSRLETTEIYTKVSIRRLKEVHEKTHPGANLERRPREEPLPDPTEKKSA